MLRLGVRNARRRSGRSLLTIGLAASATFLVVGLAAFRMAPDSGGRDSSSGGFTLYAEAAVSMPYSLDSPEERDPLQLSDEARAALAEVDLCSLRLRSGDPTSCTNLYQASKPRVLGASRALIERGGFRFAGVLDAAARDNPWRLLEEPLPDDAIPVIGDEAAVRWQLHAGLGRDIMLTDERGVERRLRFVALLSGSPLQDELIVSDASFLRLFPTQGGRAFFLIDAPAERQAPITENLERDLASFGLDVRTVAQRMRGYLAVQNTYITTFQTLGGFGLAMGAVGLVALSLRNVFERRRELALLRAVGYGPAQLTGLLVAENAFLIGTGLGVGLLAALVAVAPAAPERPAAIPWATLGLTLAGVGLIGVGAGAWATRAALRAPIVAALRSD
jgi:hypothetical protein